MKRQAVTAVIVNFNGGALLAASLDALARQAVDRIVVVDNASSDGSWRAAERDGVTLLRSAVNRGFAGAVNDALVHAGDGYVLLLNADVELGDDYVERLVTALDADAGLAAVTGLLLLDADAIDSSGIELTTARWGADRDRGRSPEVVTRREPFGVSGAAALFRREALAAGLWEALFVYWEDIELAWRLRRQGWRFGWVDARATHARGSDSAPPDFVEAASAGGRVATIARHEGVVGLLRPTAFLVTAVTAGRLAVRHPRALVRARLVRSVRTGLTARRGDRGQAWPEVPELPFSAHPWRAWLAAQVSGRRRGYGAVS